MRISQMTPIKVTTEELKWYEFDPNNKATHPPKGLYIVMYKHTTNSIGAAYWNVYRQQWEGFYIGEDGELAAEQIQYYAEFPKTWKKD